MNSQQFPAIEIEPQAPAQTSVIWLHGLGANGNDFVPIVPHLNLPSSCATRFIFPHAPHRAVTINGGAVMPAWYDLTGMEFTQREDNEGIRASETIVRHFIEREIERGIASKHIILAGFSQGGALALHTGLRYAKPLAGIMALSTYLPLQHTLKAERKAANQQTPILMIHGQQDSIVPPSPALQSQQCLTNLGYCIEWHELDMGHTVNEEEIATIAHWLAQTLCNQSGEES